MLFICIVFINIFVNILHIISILNKSLGSLKGFNSVPSLLLIEHWYLASYESLAYKDILSISGWLSIKFNNAFVFPNPEPPIISILKLYFVTFMFYLHNHQN